MRVERIISGGQTGADQGGLLAGRDLGIPTGGTAPWGWMTEDGPAPELLEQLGLVESHYASYPARTLVNVKAADASVIFGNLESPGSHLTRTLCLEQHRPFYIVHNPAGMSTGDIVGFRAWLLDNKVKTLNVAGNRESRNFGIGAAVHKFLLKALTEES